MVAVAALAVGCARSPEEFSREKPGGLAAEAHAAGAAMMTSGARPYDMTGARSIQGTIDIKTVDVGDRMSDLQNIDQIDVTADLQVGSDRYTIKSQQAMPR